MNSEFKSYKMGEILAIKHGFAFKGEYFDSEGHYILLTPGNFYEKGGFKFTPDKEKYYLGTFPKEYICSKGDLIVAMTEQAEGLLGSTALVPVDNIYLHNQRVGLVTFDIKKVDKIFLYYLFRINSVRKQIRGSASGSKVKHTAPERIYDVKINLPHISIQKKIADVLSALDSKIDLNNRINSELESMAKTLYDYWFVQFDFPDKNSKPYKSSGGRMVWNAELKREIPVGWDSITINQILAKENTTIKIQTSEILLRGSIPVIDQSSDYIAGYTNVIEAKIQAGIPRIIFGDHTRILKLINFDFARGADGTQIMISNNTRMPQFLFYHTLLKIDLSSYGYARHFKFLKDFKIVLPDVKIAKTFNDFVFNFYELIKHNIFENHKLSSLREWLLPMLMNGQVKVN